MIDNRTGKSDLKLSSSIPLHERDREPASMAQGNGKRKSPKLVQARVNNIGPYVKKNLTKAVKPRHGENR